MNTSLFHPLSDKNKFGYYTVGNYCTYSKYDAHQVSKQTGKELQWYFNDVDFDLHNWRQEPSQSLWELYRQRAQQLRDKYDYLVLWYSGGSDSHNIAETFLRNNIHLDEIAMYVNSEGKQGFDKNTGTNAEPLHVGLPYATQYKEQSPGTNVRLFDMFPLITSKLQDNEFLESLSYGVNNIGGPHHLVKPFIRDHEDYQKIINSGKTVCFIWGCDKPRVSCHNGLWHFQFVDLVDGSVRPHTQMFNNSYDHDEFFYWSPDCPELVIKQAHIVKNYYSTALGIAELESNKLLFSSSSNDFIKKGIEFVRCPINGSMPFADTVRKLIYPYWDTSTFTIGKSKTGEVYGARDTWLYNSNVENIKDNYFAVVNKAVSELYDARGLQTSDVTELIKGAGVSTPSGIRLPTALRSFQSKKYFLN